MVRWMADKTPKMGSYLAMLRQKEQPNTGHRWEPWHTEKLNAMLGLLNKEIRFIKANDLVNLEDLDLEHLKC